MPHVLEAAERLGGPRHGWKMEGAASPGDLKPRMKVSDLTPWEKAKLQAGVLFWELI